MTHILTEQELIEQLADKEHASWARWMAYLLASCLKATDAHPDDLVIPAKLASNWWKQIESPYAVLSEREKQMDRDEVARILPLIREARKMELYHAMIVIERSGGTNPDMTRVITTLMERMQELDNG